MAGSNYTSRRGYLSQTELAQFADITVTDATEADDQISQAEELIDAYVGVQDKAMDEVIEGKATAGGSASITLQTKHQNMFEQDYFIYAYVEIIGGTGSGQNRRCTASAKAGQLTVDSAWLTAPDATSIYRISQIGKFPRRQDEFYNSEETPPRYYRSIPEAVRRAVAAQVEYIIEMGTNFFKSDKSEKQSESIGDYSYTNAAGGAGIVKLIAPKAKILLRGIVNRTGRIIV